MSDEIFVTLQRYKTDLACYKAKNDFIASKVRALIASYNGDKSLFFNQVDYVLELLETPAGMFISDEEWKKAGR